MTSYSQTGYTVVRELIPAALVEHLASYAQVLAGADRFSGGGQVPGSLQLYGDPGFDAVLLNVTKRLGEASSLRLAPTYSFARIYRRGQALAAHRDRPECEHSASLHLAASSNVSWPIFMKDAVGATVEIDLEPGDAIMYRGADLIHWRDPSPHDWFVQLFLHYVDNYGPNAARRRDGRLTLGVERRAGEHD